MSMVLRLEDSESGLMDGGYSAECIPIQGRPWYFIVAN